MATPFDTDPTELLSRHQERIRRLIARRVAPDDAADVEQEVWVAALERPPRHAAALPSCH
jgi:DNA-directed RNA polymerase specialized sigma24 family protein